MTRRLYIPAMGLLLAVTGLALAGCEDAGKKPLSGVADVRILAYRSPGLNKTWLHAKPLADGAYEVTFQPTQPGSYLLHVEAPSIGLALHQNRLALITVE